MKSDIYHLVTLNDGKSDTAAIVKTFSDMAAKRLKSDLTLLNFCNEMPVSYGAQILSVDTDSVELSVHEHQALMIKQDKCTLVKSKHFHSEYGVHCFAAYVNVPKKTVILHNFAYAQIRAERREAVRVRVSGNVPIKFACNDVNIEGSLQDISTNGLSLTSTLAPTLAADQPGQLSFALNGTPVTVRGKFIRSVTDGAAGGYTHIFQIITDMVVDNTIGRFIFQRQVEIMQQLKENLAFETT